MKKVIFVAIMMVFITGSVNAAEGILNIESQFSVKKTADRLEKILNKKGLTIFNRINHSKNAEKFGIQFNKTELIIFGNPKAGGPLMKCQQTIAIDLPLKALIWEDENKKVWISYNDMNYLEKRHGIKNCGKSISSIAKKLINITTSAANQ